MVATPRSTEPEDVPDEKATLPEPIAGPSDVAAQIIRSALQIFEAARDERERLQVVARELRNDRDVLDRRRIEIEHKLHVDREALDRRQAEIEYNERARSERDEVGKRAAQQSPIRSLQFIAGCALAGVVLTGIVFGHDIHGFDPGYAGGLLGLVAGGSVWALRGL